MWVITFNAVQPAQGQCVPRARRARWPSNLLAYSHHTPVLDAEALASVAGLCAAILDTIMAINLNGTKLRALSGRGRKIVVFKFAIDFNRRFLYLTREEKAEVLSTDSAISFKINVTTATIYRYAQSHDTNSHAREASGGCMVAGVEQVW